MNRPGPDSHDDLAAQTAFAGVRVVLSRPTHPGNIGAVARAMKTMRLRHLWLVAPRRFPAPEANALAAGAEDVLEQATICQTLAEAVRDCHLVVGASVRARRIGWPALAPAEAARRLIDATAAGSVALVFGQERTGLTNDELDLCHAVVAIPADPDYSSLNLAGAVQILAYELLLAGIENRHKADTGEAGSPVATQDEMLHFYSHLEQVLVEIDFLDPSNPRFLMRRLKRLFSRAGPDKNEINILRGILTAVQRSRGHS